jgi:hypothetical protein
MIVDMTTAAASGKVSGVDGDGVMTMNKTNSMYLWMPTELDGFQNQWKDC